jgi:hypothetical protein
MNKENAHQYLPLVQALAEGKTIQHNYNDAWQDMLGDSIAFGNVPEHYRIKPEPREWRITRWRNVDDTAAIHGPTLHPEETIRVREILD